MRYHNITKDDMLNGDGLRVVLWVAGCTHCCKECQNPVTWDPDGGLLFDEAAKQEIFEQLDKDYISGITFSGGDPLHPANSLDVKNFMCEIKEKYPVPENVAKKKLENEETLKKIFTGEDKRFLAIIGPCSADNPEAVIDYVHRLAKVQEEIKDKVFIVP